MSSLVQKWQAIKKQEEASEDESDEEDHAAKAEAQIEQWRQEQITRYLPFHFIAHKHEHARGRTCKIAQGCRTHLEAFCENS